jgi:RNA polymerase sigma-70 factor (ECF subfamily)
MKNYRTYSDEELMRLLSMQGEAGAFSELYDRYGSRMHRYFYRLLGQNTHRADDFTQDLFLKIIEKGSLYDARRRFSTWIYTVAGNMVKNEYRRLSRIPELPRIPEQYEVFFSEKIDNLLFEKELTNALSELDEVQRQCFILRYQEELPMKDIAEILDCPEGTVKSRLFYTLKKLANRLRAFAGVAV